MTPEHVWTTFKVSYDPVAGTAQGGPSGTVFFIDDTTFLTCHHGNEVNSAANQPNPGFPNVRLFLVNILGDIIQDFEIVNRLPNIDVAIGRIQNPHPAIRVCPLQTEINAGDSVFNLGFPHNQMVKCSCNFQEGSVLIERVRVTLGMQAGTVLTVAPLTIHAIDVNLQNVTVSIMDYTSILGYSGGPLVSRDTNRVIGLMSFVMPGNIDVRQPVVAIRMADIQPHL